MKIFSLLFLFCAVAMIAFAQTPRTFIMDANRLERVKKKVEQKDPTTLNWLMN